MNTSKIGFPDIGTRIEDAVTIGDDKYKVFIELPKTRRDTAIVYRKFSSDNRYISFFREMLQNINFVKILFISYVYMFMIKQGESPLNYKIIMSSYPKLDKTALRRLEADLSDKIEYLENEFAAYLEKTGADISALHQLLYPPIIDAIIKAATSDNYIIKAKRKSERNRRSLLLNIVEEEIEKISKKGAEAFNILYRKFFEYEDVLYLTKLRVLKSLFDKFEAYVDKINIIEDYFKLNQLRKEDLNALISIMIDKKIITSYLGKRRSCMSKTCRYQELNYHPDSNVDSHTTCPVCGKRSIIEWHTFFIDEYFEIGWRNGFLQEFLLASVLSLNPKISKIYISSNLHLYHPQGATKGLEIDNLIITKNDEIIALEVSTQSEMENVVTTIINKYNKLIEWEKEYLRGKNFFNSIIFVYSCREKKSARNMLMEYLKKDKRVKLVNLVDIKRIQDIINIIDL